jgi:hypothetical protein
MQPKKFNKYLLPLAVTAALSSTSVLAATANYSVGFTTVPDIGITQVQAMNFGSGLSLASGVACAMAVTNAGNSYPGDQLLRIAGATADTVGTEVGDLTGAGCTASVGSKGTIGIYRIDGIAGGTVRVTVNNSTGNADFDYTATGCIGDYVAGTAGDICDAVTPGVAVDVRLADASDTVGNGATEGIPNPGQARIVLGGSITTTAVHTAGQTLTESFNITVTY